MPATSRGSGFVEDQIIRWVEQADGLAVDPSDVVQPVGMGLGDYRESVIAAG
jgi:hypothetical protein